MGVLISVLFVTLASVLLIVLIIRRRSPRRRQPPADTQIELADLYPNKDDSDKMVCYFTDTLCRRIVEGKLHEGAKTDNCHNSWQEHGIQLYCIVLLQ